LEKISLVVKMKKYFVTKSEDIFNFHIFTNKVKVGNRKYKRKRRKKNNQEVSLELLLDIYKNGK